nr:hypothetical protein [Tanacetum cinerariifolium]
IGAIDDLDGTERGYQRRCLGKDFTDVLDDETTLTFLIDLGYKGPLNGHTNMFVDHMHQPWRTLAKYSGRSSKSVVIQDTPSAPKLKPAISKTKLKGAPSLTPQEQEAADIIQAFKESKKTSKIQPGTGGSNEGIGSKPWVPDESTVVSATSSEGTGAKPGVPDKDKDITKEKELVKEPIAEVIMDDVGNDLVHDDDQPQAASKSKTSKTLNPKWFKQPPRPPTLDLEWNKRQVVLDQPLQPWFNQIISASKDPL